VEKEIYSGIYIYIYIVYWKSYASGNEIGRNEIGREAPFVAAQSSYCTESCTQSCDESALPSFAESIIRPSAHAVFLE